MAESTYQNGQQDAPGAAGEAGGHPPPRPGHVVRVDLAAGEWMLTLPPAPRATAAWLRPPAENLARRLRAAAPGSGAYRTERVPDAALDPRLGLAVVHCTPSRGVLCCPASQISGGAARTLAAFASTVTAMAGHAAAIPIALVPCADLPAVMHPAGALAAPGDPAVRPQLYACENQISRELAEAIGWLASAWLAYSADVTPPPGRAGGARRCAPAGSAPPGRAGHAALLPQRHCHTP